MKRTRRSPDHVAGNHPFRRILLEKKEALLSGFGVKFDPAVKFEYKAEEDQAQISHDEFVCMLINGMDYLQLRLIEEALDRIVSGDYGTCMECDTPIPVKRLKALPWARYCVSCQEQLGARPERELPDEKPRILSGGQG